MTDFTRDGDSDRRSISRRRFVSTTAAAGVLATGRTAAQNDDDGGGGDGGGSAVNVGTTDTIENADEVRFDEAIPVGELAQLFIEFDTADHPVIGTDIQFQGVVLNAVASNEERTAVSANLEWNEFEWEGDRILSPLFEPMAWVSGGDVSLESSFYDEYQLVRLAGTADADQRFFDRYGSVPYVWGVVPATESVQPGTVVDVTGTVEYAGRDDSTVEFGASGVYLTVTGLVDRGQRTTISASTSSGDHASFLGTQLRTQPQLTTGLADLEYSYETEFPRPAGGSIVTHEGQVDSTDYESGGVDTASMRTTGQRIVVGETRPGQWEAESGDSGDSAEPEFPNTVAVLDTSGSMDQRDTVSGDSRIAVAKQSARSLVNFVENGNKLGIVDFDYRATTTSSLESLDEDARGVMKDDIDRLSPSGGTSIGAGLREALDLLRGTTGPKSIILLSDGEHNEPPSPDSILPELKSLGVTIYTIGMGSSAGETLLERLADETGGQSAFRPEPGEIRQVFQQFSISVQNRSQITSERVELTEGDTASGSATVDGSCDEVQFSLSYPGSEITLQPETPTGEPLSEGDGVIHRVGETSEIWTVEEPETGDWSFTMTGEQLSRPEVATTEVSADSPIDADLFINDFHYEQTGMFRVELKATNGEQRYTGGDVTLTATNGDETEEIALRDDRGGPDPVGNDGIYTGYFHPESTGEYTFSAAITGGEVADLQRDFTRRLRVDEVVDPIRPYREREPLSSDTSSTGLLERLEQYAPIVGVAAVGAILAKRYWLGGDDGAGTAAEIGAETDTGSDAEAETDTGSDAEAETDTGSDAEAGTDAETGSETGTATGTDAETGIEVGGGEQQ